MGQYRTAQFTKVSDGHGGTLIDGASLIVEANHAFASLAGAQHT
jgi:hypothetical protein